MRLPAPAIVLPLLLAAGCSTPLIRVAEPEAGAGAPRLEEAIDLGGLPLPAQGELSQDAADERYTPGEWVALVGANLHGATSVTVGPRQLPVAGYLQGGSLLVRVPRDLAPGRHSVRIETPAGSAATLLPTSAYAFASDTHGDAVRFRRLGPDGAGFEEEGEAEVELELARFQVVSADGALLYAIQKPVLDIGGVPAEVSAAVKVARRIKGGEVRCELVVVHLGAKDAPSEAGRVTLTLDGKPTGLARVGADRLVVLQPRQLTVLDVSDPLAPRAAGVLPLGPESGRCELVDAECLDGERWLAVLEAYANEVHLVDLADPARPVRASGVRLSKEIGEPFSIDLVLGDDQTAWVLQGPNLRLAGQRLLDGLKAIGRDLVAFEFGRALEDAGSTASGVVMDGDEGLCRLVQVRLDSGQLAIARSLPLSSDLFPFFALPDGAGGLYVSGINRDVFDLAGLELSWDGLNALLDMLKDTAQLGRVIRVDLRTARAETVRKGVAIYYDLCLLPSGELMTSTIRLGPGYLPPRITLDWGLDSGQQFSKLREVANSTFSLTDALKKLMPPYDYERIGVQR